MSVTSLYKCEDYIIFIKTLRPGSRTQGMEGGDAEKGILNKCAYSH